MARNPLDIDLGVGSQSKDGLKVFDNLEREVFSWGRVGFGTSSYSSLVVDEDPDGIGVLVVLYPMSGIQGCLEDTKQLCVINLHMSS